MLRHSRRPVAFTVLLSLPASLTVSCETTEQTTGLGAASGALVGAGVGAAIDRHGPEGAIIGGLAGALAGGVVGYAVGRRLESRDQAQTYLQQRGEWQPGPAAQEVLDIREIRVTPPSVRAGGEVDIDVVHSFVGPAGMQPPPTDVRVRLTDLRGNTIVDQTQRRQFDQGTFQSTISILVPSNLPSGNYGVDVAMSDGRVGDNQSGTVQVLGAPGR